MKEKQQKINLALQKFKKHLYQLNSVFQDMKKKQQELNGALEEACLKSEYDLEKINDFISQGADVLSSNWQGYDILYEVCTKNPQPQLIEFLIKKQADPNKKYRIANKETTLLHQFFTPRPYLTDYSLFIYQENATLSEQDYIIIETLLKNKANPNILIQGSTFLYSAAITKKLTFRLASLFCDYGGDLDIQTPSGQTVLWSLLEIDQKLELDVLLVILKNQKKMILQVENNITYLHYYCGSTQFNLEGFKLFIQHGYDPHALFA